jgi:hypothetical protein
VNRAILRFVCPINTHGLRPIELVKASSERRLVEVMHQALKALVRVARRQPGSPLQFRIRL